MNNEQEFNVGDKVWIDRGAYQSRLQEGTIKKLTATQIVVDCGRCEERYRRKDLVKVGERYRPNILRYDDAGALKRNQKAEGEARARNGAFQVEEAAHRLRKRRVTAEQYARLLEIANEIDGMGVEQ